MESGEQPPATRTSCSTTETDEMESREQPPATRTSCFTTETDEMESREQPPATRTSCFTTESTELLENEEVTSTKGMSSSHPDNRLAANPVPVPESKSEIFTTKKNTSQLETSNSTTDHVKLQQSKERTLSCQYCSKLFLYKSNRSRHEQICKSKTSKSNLIKCTDCEKTFTRKDALQRHLLICRVKTNKPEHSMKFHCEVCNCSFGNKFNLLRHQKVCSSSKVTNTPCLVEKCTSQFFQKTSLIEHLKTKHADEVFIKDPISKKFSSMKEFLLWKESEEEGCYSYFSMQSGKKKNKEYYYCQHDGSAKHHEKKKTSRSNLKGRVKVGHHCIAKMKVWLEKTDVYVEYYPTHSHKCSPKDFMHHPIPHEVSDYINKQLAEEVSPKKIYRKVKKIHVQRNTKNVQSLRINSLTKKRIRERARKLHRAQRMHSDDAKSVFLLAKANEESILIYKPYMDKTQKGPKEIDLLPNSRELFLLAIQTDRQRDLMKKFSGKVFVVDDTHGTNQYKYHLLTCMVVDDNHRGWPVAHLISSKCDSATITFFFETIKENVGESIITDETCVITDDDPALINAMKAGFKCKLRHLLCYWHLLKAMKDNLRTKVPKSFMESMMEEIRVIISEKNESQFLKLAEGFLHKYQDKDETASFIAYFKSYYLTETRVEKWAHCYRNFYHGGVNTTGHLESFHNKLKQEYLNRKVNKRLDDLVNILLEIEWEDYTRRNREASLGFLSQPQEVYKRHKDGVSIDDESLNQTLENIWEFKSASSDTTYSISKFAMNCSSDLCFCKCGNPGCPNLCSHMYTCSCPDRHPLCKHIHKLHSFLTRHEPQEHQMEANFYEFMEPDQATSFETERLNLHEKKFNSLRIEVRSNISALTKFESNLSLSKASVHSLTQMKSVLSNLVQCLEMRQANEENSQEITLMPAAESYHSQEKLKTQITQISSFKKPIGKRKRTVESSLTAEKKKKVIKNLSEFLPGTSSDNT